MRRYGLYSLRVRTKIGIAVGLTLVTSVAVAAAGLAQAANLRDDIQTINERNVAGLNKVMTVQQTLGKVTLFGMESRVTTDPEQRRDLLRKHSETINDMQVLLSDYMNHPIDNDEWQETVENLRRRWKEFRTNSQTLQRAYTETLEYRAAYVNYVPTLQQVDAAVDRLADYERWAADRMSRQSSVTYVRARWSICAVLIAGLVIALLLTAIVARTIVRPLAEVQQVMRAVAAGDLSQRARVRGRDEVGMMAASVNQASDCMRLAFDRVQQLATTDELTGAFNRRHFTMTATSQLQVAQRGHRPLVAMMVDIDHFKRVNDTYGHATGDEVIRSVARVLQGQIRKPDVFGRYGGEEFAVVHSEMAGDPLKLGERLRTAVEAVAVPGPGHPIEVTVSIGVAELKPDDDLETLLERADKALYRAKETGRNRVVAG
jgi:diguanylate cyclase (GGDEF)-like protein